MSTSKKVMIPKAVVVVLILCVGISCSSRDENEVRTLSHHKEHVSQTRFSNKNDLLATCSFDGTVVVLDLATMKKKYEFSNPRRYFSICFSPDDRLLAASNVLLGDLADTWGIVELWDLKSGKLLETLKGDVGSNPISNMAFSPDEKWLALGGSSRGHQSKKDEPYLGEVQLWDMQKRKPTHTIRSLIGYCSGLVFSKSDSTIFICFTDDRYSEVVEYDLVKMQARSRWEGQFAAFALHHYPDKKSLLIVGGTRSLKKISSDGVMWNYETGKEVKVNLPQSAPIFSMVESPDHKQFLCGGGEDSFDHSGEVMILSSNNFEKLIDLSSHFKERVTSVDWSSKNQISVASSDSTVKLFNYESLARLKK